MNLRNYVDWKLTHSDKTAESEGYPLVMENCKNNKRMKDLKVYGKSVQDGEPSPENPIEVLSVGNLVTDESDVNFGKYKIPIVQRGKNLLNPTVVSTESFYSDAYISKDENAYGTVLDSTDLTDNKVAINQTPNPDYPNAQAYQNGYICIQNMGLEVGKKYILSFDIDITKNPMNVTYIAVLPGGESPNYNAYFTENKQRVSVTFVEKRSAVTARPPYIVIRCMGMSFTASNFMITEEGYDTSFEPYAEPTSRNLFLDSPLGSGEYVDFRRKKVFRANGEEEIQCELPKLTSKTTVFETNTTVSPSNMYGKFIKR